MGHLTKALIAASLSLAAAARAGAADVAPPAGAVETVVVTAERRNENVQDVPIAIQAMSAAQLRASHQDAVKQLQTTVPALNYATIGGNYQIFLRGIGSTLNDPNLDSAVATYIDGYYVDFTKGLNQSLLYLDHVEVLEGPQATLFGRNADGGAISLVTRTPSDVPSTDLEAGIGDYGEKLVRSYVEQPLGDHLFAGLYAYATDRQTYLTQLVPNGNTPDHEGDWGARGKLVYAPTDALRITLSADYSQASGSEGESFRQVQPNAVGYVVGSLPFIDQRYVTSLDFPTYDHIVDESVNLRIDYDIGWAKLVDLSSARNISAPGTADFDGTAAQVFAFSGNTEQSRSFSQELQILSPDTSRISWIGGLSGFWSRSGYPASSSGPGLQEFAPPAEIDINSVVKTASYAAYAQATVPLVDEFRLTAGLRYTYEGKDWDSPSYAIPLYGIDEVFPDRHHSWNAVTPKVTLDDRIGDTLVYLTYSQGFKSGAYNVSAPNLPPGEGDVVNPENLFDYEAGTKSDLFDRRVRLNTSVYYYVYKDIQQQILDPSCGGTCLVNVGGAHIYGAEVSAVAALTDELSVNGSVAYNHSEYTDTPNYAGFAPAAVGNMNVSVDITGREVQRSPKLVFSLGADYDKPLPNGDSILLHADFYRNGGFNWEPQGILRQGSYNLLGASAEYRFSSRPISVSVWGKNLTNQYYVGDANISTLGTLIIDGEPRMFGLTVDYHT